jgi:sodium/glucose cotransporter 9
MKTKNIVEDNFESKEEVDVKEFNVFKKAFFFICGIESQIDKNETEEIEETNMDTSIDEDPFWSRVCDINAIIAMSLAGFSIAFFNKYN